MSFSSHSKSKTIISIFFFLGLLGCIKEHPKKTTVISSKNENTAIKVDLSKKYSLSKKQNYELEEKFKTAVENAYLETYSHYNINFVYTISPEGTIYPFSDVDIRCIIQSPTTSQKVKDVCIHFFKILDSKVEKIKEGL